VIVGGDGSDQIYGGPGADRVTTGQDKAVLYPLRNRRMTTAQATARRSGWRNCFRIRGRILISPAISCDAPRRFL